MTKQNTTSIFFRITLLLSFLILINISGQAQNSDVVGKITVGYQGWFATKGDGSPIDVWWHWTQNWSQLPSPNNNGIVSWPDTREYTSTYNTAWPLLGNGQPAKLFSSYNDQTINTQFLWMRQNGIDCAALQRFNPNGQEGPIRDAITAKVKTASESNNVKFYIMYDVSGWTNMQSEIKSDWMNKMSKYISSPAYARHNGKPVVCIWGFGFSDDGRPFSPDQSIDVINWFKDQGCYVIGGVPTYWRTENNDSRPGFLNVYKALNMISPWMVGRIGSISDIDNFYNNVNKPDQEFCNANGIDYQPCVLPGDLQSRHRAHGLFMWRQFYNFLKLGVQGIYISMFDEYNEANQIAKTADSYFDIPSNQYFFTTSEDGTYVASDFYLRMVGKAGKVLKGLEPITESVNVPFSVGPVYFRTTFEPGFDAMPSWTDAPDSSVALANVTSSKCYTVQQNPHVGLYALRFEGKDNSSTKSKAYLKVFDVDIPVNLKSELSFWTFPTNEISRFVSVDLVMTDGSTLKGTNAMDINGISMKPSKGRGIVNAWSETVCKIGKWLNGKTIDRIIVGYDHPEETGNILSYIEDISITDGSRYGELPGIATAPSPADKATNINIASGFSWTPGPLTTSHDVYFGTLNNLVYKGNFTKNTFNPGILAKNATYYWRVDERNLAGKKTGSLWSFTTASTGNSPEIDHTDPVGRGVIKTRNQLSQKTAKRAYDNQYTSKWIDIGTIPCTNNPAWIQIQLPQAVNVNELTLASADNLPQSDPANFALKASNNGTNWITLGKWQGQKWVSRKQRRSFTFANSIVYSYYRLEITKNQNNLPLTQIGEIELIGPSEIPPLPSPATNPLPVDMANKVSLSPVLAWKPGTQSTSHNVFFGTTTSPELKVNQTDTIYIPGKLANNTTYYWRIDEKNITGTTTGPLWSFTTVASSNSIIDSCDSLDGWNSSNPLSINNTEQKEGTGALQSSGIGIDEFSKAFSPVSTVSNAKLQFWYYVSDVTKFNGENQIELGSGGGPDANEFNWSMPTLVNGWNLISLSLSSANVSGSPNPDSLNWFRIYHFKNDSMIIMIDDIRLIGESGNLPGFATNPNPANGSVNADIASALSWIAGYNSTTHDVYFGTTNPPVFKANQAGTTFNPGPLVNNITYYWRVNEKNGSGTTVGPVWNFTTAPAELVPGLIDNCDHTTGWNSSNLLTENTLDKKEGLASLQSEGNGIDEYSKVFGPYDMTGYQTLQFWYYVSDITKFNDENQIELGSAGHPDADEYHWSLSGLISGWNLITLNLSDAGKDGNPDISALNWFRMYHVKNGSLVTKIDEIKMTGAQGARLSTKETEDIEKSENLLNVFPNPSNSYITVAYHLKEKSSVALQLYDMNGAVVDSIYRNKQQSEGSYEVKLDLSMLRSGVYIIRLSTINRTLIKKVHVLK